MDFFQIHTREVKGGALEAYPDFIVGRSEDLMVQGRAFRAIWDDAVGLWSTDEYDVQRLVDLELRAYAEKYNIDNVKYMRSFTSNGWTQFRKFLSQISDNAHQLDNALTFANTPVKKKDYVSKRLPYALAPGDISAWDELVGTLYAPEEREKIEWAIGAVVSGDSKKIQKFLVLYGPAGTGKSTILNIMQKLFNGYTTTFEAKALGSNNNSFATEVFGNNPLVAIQHDGDLSQIADNTKLNSIVSHEDMTFNKKYHPSYTARSNAMLFMGTNQPVKISDAKSGIIRRLIDVNPTGIKLQPKHYHALMARIEFELGAIAHHCLEVYRQRGVNYYNNYQPLEMMFQTDIFFNFIEWNYDLFKQQDGTTLKQAYTLYKEFCDETGIDRNRLPQYKVREELRNYFEEFHDRTTVDGVGVRSYYSGFRAHSFKVPVDGDSKTFALVLDETISLLDLECADLPAQPAKEDGTPQRRWIDVKTTLADINSSELHYLKLEDDHIVIDFDLKDDTGEKSLEKNLEAASAWPATYAELSKSGAGVHLHYRYVGDPSELARTYADGIEIKVFTGDSSLRRRLSRCNSVPIARIDSGLPLKEKKVLTATTIQSERGLRQLILRNLRKEIHPGTKPSIDFIKKILDDAYLAGMEFNVEDMRSDVIAFATSSSNRALECLKIVKQMRWKSDDPINDIPFDPPYTHPGEGSKVDDRVTFFDIEVFPNLLVVCWKFENDPNVIRMINPSPTDIEGLFRMKLVGFNNRRYDNHILWARFMGYDNEGLYRLSKKMIDEKSVGAMFGEAYSVSYADIYDFSSKKQGLKKFEVELGMHHMELDIPWDEPVPEELWPKVVEYCVNDVLATEATFEARRGDFMARQILAELSGLTVNDTTAKHTARIIFGEDRNPQKSFVYTDLSKQFPGYVFDHGKSTYRGEEVGEGGYVYAEKGMYEDVVLLDVASMHPTSIRELNLFGEYTPNFWALVEARLAIKREQYDDARKLLNGRLAPFLEDTSNTKPLSDALKIVINIVYGLTSAKFDNPFRDMRNVDNIVAKRGALFMINLKGYVQDVLKKQVVHIKTDSIKIPGATPDDIRKIKEFGEQYGYEFEHEATYDKFCLVNDAVYIARVGWTPSGKGVGKWSAVGAQFQHPYVFKKLFSGEEITFEDLQETKSVTKGAMYLDFDGVTPMALVEGQSTMRFVGRTGRFIPVLPGYSGGNLYRVQDEKRYAVAGTKGYLWIETEMGETLGYDAIDMGYFEGLLNEARTELEKYGDFEGFVS